MGNMEPQALSSFLSLSGHKMSIISPTCAFHSDMLPPDRPQGQLTMEWHCLGCCQDKPVLGLRELAQ